MRPRSDTVQTEHVNSRTRPRAANGSGSQCEGLADGRTTERTASAKLRVFQLLHGGERGGLARVIDAALLSLIALNVVMVVLETVRPLRQRLGTLFEAFEA